jgi:hypothetical protein
MRRFVRRRPEGAVTEAHDAALTELVDQMRLRLPPMSWWD